jgi:aspartate-semialdehyde dehydrogenase
MSGAIDVAVVGATGVVGEAMLEILAERKFPLGKVHALASERSVGKTVMFGNKPLTVSDVAEFDFSQCKIGLFSAGAAVSDVYAPLASAAGCIVVDNTSRFRYDDEIPLVVPEVNPEKIVFHWWFRKLIRKKLWNTKNPELLQIRTALPFNWWSH